MSANSIKAEHVALSAADYQPEVRRRESRGSAENIVFLDKKDDVKNVAVTSKSGFEDLHLRAACELWIKIGA